VVINKGEFMSEYRIVGEPRFNSGAIVDALDLLSLWCHKANEKWWQDPSTQQPIQRNHGELMMLMVSEIVEAMEGQRKDLMDDKLPHRKMVEVELADALIRIFDYAGAHDMDLGGALVEKMEYNSHREDHKHENRLKPGGKKF
jgi:NTP pyrophosphatase (non-canonical NTP hydrolase)